MIVIPQPAPAVNTSIPKATATTLGDSQAAGAALPFAQLLGIAPEAATAQLEPEETSDSADVQTASGEEAVDDTQEIVTPPGVTMQTLEAPKPDQRPDLTASLIQALGEEAPSAQLDEPALEGPPATEGGLRLEVAPGAQSASLPRTPTLDASGAPPLNGEPGVTPPVGGPPVSGPPVGGPPVGGPPVGGPPVGGPPVGAATPATRPAEGLPTLAEVAEPLATTQLAALDVNKFVKVAASTQATAPALALLQAKQAERGLSTAYAEPLTQAQSVASTSTLPTDAASVTVARASAPGQEAPQLEVSAVVLAARSKSDPDPAPTAAPTLADQPQPRTDASHATVTDTTTPQIEPMAPTSGEAVVTGVAPAMSVRVDAPQAPGVVGSPAQPAAVAMGLPSATVGQIQEMQQAGQTQRRIVIRLDPPELGNVRLELRTVGDDVLVAARTETAEAARAILRHLPEVRSAVEALGLSLSQFDVETSNEQEARHRFGQGSRHRADLGEPDADTSETEAERTPEEHNEGAIFL